MDSNLPPSGLSHFEDTHQSLGDALEHAINAIEGDTVSLRQLLALIGEQSLLLLCALLTIPFMLPVSVPGVSTVFGLAIIMISLSITVNRLPWLPSRLLDRRLDVAQLVPVLWRGLKWVRRLDRFVHPRMTLLTTGAVMNRLNGLSLVFGGVLMLLPLGLVPFSNTLPALAILLTAMGISQRDGLFVMLGYLMLGVTVVYFCFLAYLAFAAGQGLASLLGSG